MTDDVLAELTPGPDPVRLRPAREHDVPAIVGLLAADQLGAARDGVRSDADLAAYLARQARSTPRKRVTVTS